MTDHQLETLRRQYFALVPAYLLSIPSTQSLSPKGQKWLVEALLETDIPQPEDGYRRSFWRKLLPDLEAAAAQWEEDEEVDERIYNLMAELMVLPSSSMEPPPSHKTFIYDRPESLGGGEGRVTLFEEQVAVQAGSTGLRTWTAALHLGHHILHSSKTLFEPDGLPPVVELGAGTGFLSILLAQLGADVIATDLDDGEEGDPARRTPLGLLRANLALNPMPQPPEALALDWSHAADKPAHGLPRQWRQAMAPVNYKRRTVIAADVIYDPDLVPLLVGAIHTLLQGHGKAIIAATVRNEDTFRYFKECSKSGMSAERIELPPMDLSAPTFWDTALDKGTRVEIVEVSVR